MKKRRILLVLIAVAIVAIGVAAFMTPTTRAAGSLQSCYDKAAMAREIAVADCKAHCLDPQGCDLACFAKGATAFGDALAKCHGAVPSS